MDTKILKTQAPVIIGAALLGALVVWAGTMGFKNINDHQDVDAVAVADEPVPLTAPGGRSYTQRSAAPSAPLMVPAGTPLSLRLDRTLSTASDQVGESFTARVISPVVVGGRTVIPANAVVSGRVAESARSKRIGGRSRLALEFTSVSINGRSRPLSATYLALGKKQTKRDAATIAGATAGGAVLGRIIGHDKGKEADGTLAGAVVGGAIGTGVAMSNRAAHVTLDSGTTIQVELDSSLSV